MFGSKEDERKSWHAARKACMDLGGNLATIPNGEVQGTVLSFFCIGLLQLDKTSCNIYQINYKCTVKVLDENNVTT